jgi:hypothetical protein
VRERIGLVAAAFGVTERFVAMHEARDRLTRLLLGNPGAVGPLLAALNAYERARQEFIRGGIELRHDRPLALRQLGWSDFLKNDPLTGALLALRMAGRPAELPQRAVAVGTAIEEWAPDDGRELLRDAGMQGRLLPAREVAGRPRGVALPGDWASSVEPSEHHRAELTGPPAARVLRLSGSKDVTVSQWVPVGGPRLHWTAIDVRGRVLPGTAVSLVFSWLNEAQVHVGFTLLRLPDGEWPEWVTLQQAALPPAGAVWVGLGLRVQNQVADAWIEARGFTLRN